MAVLMKLLPAMLNGRPEIELTVALNPQVELSGLAAPQFDGFHVDSDGSLARLFWWYEVALPAAMKRHGADMLFSVTNYMPRRAIDWPSVLLVQHAGHFSREFDRLRYESSSSLSSELSWRLKSGWVRRSIERCTVLTVQTGALADAIAVDTTKRRNEIRVIPHGPGWVSQRATPLLASTKVPWRIGYVSKWGVQKNFDVLLHAVRDINRLGFPATLVLTLNPSLAPVKHFMTRAQAVGADRFLENLGEVGSGDITSVYDSLDVFVFPSVCESFGMPMVEAMARGVPIIVAETPENCEVTGGAALSFNRYDAGDLAAQVIRLMSDPDLRCAWAARSLERGRAFSWADAGAATISALYDAVRGRAIGR